MPNIHPFLVHFPIALLTVSVLTDIVALAARRPSWHSFAWWLQIIGTVGMFAAVATGLQAEATVFIPEAAHALFELHEQLAFAGSAAFTVVFLWRIAKRGSLPENKLAGFIALEILAMSLLLSAAWFGGELVFSYGVGVR
ncbi:MAG: DUF2231 domain-containing protein [Bacteroidota bacterium]